MADDDDVSVKSVEVTLLSGIGLSSAILLRDAYLPDSGEETDLTPSVPLSQTGDFHPDEVPPGPNALVTVTKITNRTPSDVVELILKKNPDHTTNMEAHDVHTVIIILCIRLGDPLTTRFINGTIDFTFSPETEILDFFPKDKGIIAAIIENGGSAVTISSDMAFGASAARSTKKSMNPEKNLFAIPVGLGETISGTYNKESGYSLDIPADLLLEYEGMVKNTHDLFWEFYPPMPPKESEISGEEMLALYSFVIQAPKNSAHEIRAVIECRVKGNLWGVIPINGSMIIP